MEARDIIPLVLIGGLILLGRRREAEEIPPHEEKPPAPPEPWLPVLSPPPEVERLKAEAEEARRRAERLRMEAEALWAEAERLKAEAEARRLEAEARLERVFREAEARREEARRIIERIRRVVEERRREAEMFTPPVIEYPPLPSHDYEPEPPPAHQAQSPQPTDYPMVELPITFEPRTPRPPGIRLSNSTLVIEDPQYIGRFITACVTWFCTNFLVQSIPHREPLEPQALRYARETRSTIVIYVNGAYAGEIPV